MMDTPLNMAAAREQLVTTFNYEADWRASLMERHPDDDRNPTAAEELRHLGQYAEGLDDNDERLQRLAGFNAVRNLADDVPLGGEAVSTVLRSVGFARRIQTDDHRRRLVADAVVAYEEDAGSVTDLE